MFPEYQEFARCTNCNAIVRVSSARIAMNIPPLEGPEYTAFGGDIVYRGRTVFVGDPDERKGHCPKCQKDFRTYSWWREDVPKSY